MLIGLCFVIGGGVGNLFDRMVYGSVTDFLYLKFGVFQTGIFNMADVSIMTGMLFSFFFNFSLETLSSFCTGNFFIVYLFPSFLRNNATEINGSWKLVEVYDHNPC